MAYMDDFLNPYLENSVTSDVIGIALISGKKRVIKHLSNWKEANMSLSFRTAVHLTDRTVVYRLSRADGAGIGNINNY